MSIFPAPVDVRRSQRICPPPQKQMSSLFLSSQPFAKSLCIPFLSVLRGRIPAPVSQICRCWEMDGGRGSQHNYNNRAGAKCSCPAAAAPAQYWLHPPGQQWTPSPPPHCSPAKLGLCLDLLQQNAVLVLFVCLLNICWDKARLGGGGPYSRWALFQRLPAESPERRRRGFVFVVQHTPHHQCTH